MSFPATVTSDSIAKFRANFAPKADAWDEIFARIEAKLGSAPSTPPPVSDTWKAQVEADIAALRAFTTQTQTALTTLANRISALEAVPVPTPTPTPTPTPVPTPTTVDMQAYPKITTLFSKSDQNSLEGKQKIAKLQLFVTDLGWWTLPQSGGQPAGMNFGQFMKTLQKPGTKNIAYWHSCLFDDGQAEYPNYRNWYSGSTGFKIAGKRYRYQPEWFLTLDGATTSGAIDASTNQIAVSDSNKFESDGFAIIGREMVKITGKSGNTLSVQRGQNAQNEDGGGFPAISHPSGTVIKQIARAFGNNTILVLNPSVSCPKADGGFGLQTWNEFSASFLKAKIDELQTLDGIFLDNFVTRIIHMANKPERTGLDDSAWIAGMKDHAQKLRAKLGTAALISGNTGGRASDNGAYINGGMIEGIDETGFNEFAVDNGTTVQQFIKEWNAVSNPAFIFNASSTKGQTDYQGLRYLLTLYAATTDGYFVYDEYNRGARPGEKGNGLNDGDHATLWLYDEYDNAGAGMGYWGKRKGPSTTSNGVMRGEFENAITLCNDSTSAVSVSLGGSFKKLKGTQAPYVNDGSIVTSVSIPAKDGLVLLRVSA